MSVFNRLPLHWRLTLLTTGVCAVALGVAFAGYFFIELWRLRGDVADRIAPVQTLLTERAVAALAENPEATEFGLGVLDLNPAVTAAAIYGADGRLLARYIRHDAVEFIPRPRDYVFELSADELVLFRPLLREQRRLGTLYLKAEVGGLVRDRLLEPARGMAMLFLGTLLLALMASRLLQRAISRPIASLALAARRVAEQRDYSVRSHVSGGGETAVLVEAFNSMLAAIQQRDQELDVARRHAERSRTRLSEINARLEEANQNLEANVRLRTAELERALVLAHDASSAKSGFLARMSHELRTPMTAIIGYAEMLLEDATDRGDEDSRRDLRRILDSARHLLSLISDVLDYSKIEAGRAELHLATFELDELVREVVETVSPLVVRAGNAFDVAVAAPLGPVHGDRAKVGQILLNLLGNSAKFTEHGRVSLSVSRRSGPDSELLVAEVVDTGIGMDAGQLGRIFTPFVQAAPSVASRYGGTGLGLAISRQFARMMGGDITAASAPGKGSTFTVIWPAHVRHPGGTAP